MADTCSISGTPSVFQKPKVEASIDAKHTTLPFVDVFSNRPFFDRQFRCENLIKDLVNRGVNYCSLWRFNEQSAIADASEKGYNTYQFCNVQTDGHHY